MDSGERHAHAGSGYNARRAECAAAARALGLASLRDADARRGGALPDRWTAGCGTSSRRTPASTPPSPRCERGDVAAIGPLLDASHASLRDLYEVSTQAVESAVARLKAAGAAGARVIGGGFGGHVVALLPEGVAPPADAVVVSPSAGARLMQP